jgi:excisionase family DNA binding protein
MTTSDWISPSEAGAILGIGPDRVAQLAREGTLGSMKTPGGHLRLRREEVEGLANPPTEPSPEEHEEEGGGIEPLQESPNPPKPKWETVSPWKRRVREAEADVHVLKLDDQREQLLEARAERQTQRERVEAERASGQAEAQRLRQLKSRALSSLPFGVPADLQAEVARQLESDVTSQRYPAGLAREHAEALLRADVERHLRPWRTEVVRGEQAQKEKRDRERIIGWAKYRVNVRTPLDWDLDTKRAFEREVHKALTEEYQPGMDQTEADEIASEVLDDWIEDDEENV